MYKFPVINHIDDVLPAIEDADEIKVADKGDYTVINYVVVTNDTFPPIKVAGGSAKMREERSKKNALRRECRGLIFDSEGFIQSSPYHKFFNIGEREETLPKNINLSLHTIMEKLDGSMIRPLYTKGRLRLGTKMGVTDIAEEAEEWLMSSANVEEKIKFLEWSMENKLTPIFEWVSPSNKIVVNYDEPDLVLTGIRNNVLGHYYDIFTLPKSPFPFTLPVRYRNDGDMEAYLQRVKSDEDREGDILRDKDGHMHKIKGDWYLELHRLKDETQSERHILRMIIEERIDDILPKLDKVDYDRVVEYQKWFWNIFKTKEESLKKLCVVFDKECKRDKKTFAVEYMKKLKDKKDARFVFGYADGKDLYEMMLDEVDKKSNKNVNYEEMLEWLKNTQR